MRIPLIAGNWKMHKTEAEAISLVRVLMHRASVYSSVEIVVFPPYTALSQLSKLLISSPIQLGAQNCSEHEVGAYTGEISPRMIAEFCSYVILGHSERRTLYSETNGLINKKIHSAIKTELKPILCIGEQLDEKNSGLTVQVLHQQLQEGLQGVILNDPSNLVIAYEPVWAIGSGQSASPEETDQIIGSVIRPIMSNLWGEETAQNVRVLYGGSVSPENAGGYFYKPEIDGALVGGASLTPEQFIDIIEKAS